MTISVATNPAAWDEFLQRQQFRPFLQSWAMGEVYRALGQEPVRLMITEGEQIKGICFAHIVPARRGRHLSVPYGPVIADGEGRMAETLELLMNELKKIAQSHACSFIRMSPFWRKDQAITLEESLPSPLHLLGEHLWYLSLVEPDPWNSAIPARPAGGRNPQSAIPRREEDIFKSMRSTTRNLIRRAEKEGVTVTCSTDPVADLPLFLQLHEETRKRHGFTAYTNAFFRAQVEEFAKTGNVLLYVARHQGNVLATSIHMRFGGETSYHHGASVQSKIPASYLLQWTAIKDALKRGDHIYNFWGIAPQDPSNPQSAIRHHPFAGVTLFKTGFGGNLLELTHCVDIPLSPMYRITRAFETVRKWKRGF